MSTNQPAPLTAQDLECLRNMIRAFLREEIAVGYATKYLYGLQERLGEMIESENNKWVVCPQCKGYSPWHWRHPDYCDNCKGSGRVNVDTESKEFTDVGTTY
jgi:hypothetical protein